MNIILSSGAGLKSIPLNSLPPEAWTSLTGQGSVEQSTILKRYEDVAWLNRGINIIADAVGSMPYCFYNKTEVDTLNDDVEPEEVIPEFAFDIDLPMFMNELAGDLTMFTGAYFFKGRNLINITKTVRRLHPTTITPIYDEVKGLIGFKRNVGATAKDYTLEEIGWIWRPNRAKELGGGTPPAAAALAAAGVLRTIDEYVHSHFTNGAMDVNIVGIEGNPPPAEVTKIDTWFKAMATGVRNAFGTRAMGGGKVTSVKLNSSMSELIICELSNEKRRDVSTALGIPQSLLFSDAANFATAHQDDLHFYDKTVIPLTTLIVGALNKHLFEPLGYKMVIKPNRLEIYQQLEAEKGGKLMILVNGGIMLPNEAREELDLEEVEGLDEVWLDKHAVIHPPEPPPFAADGAPMGDKPEDEDEDKPRRFSNRRESEADPEAEAEGSVYRKDVRKWHLKARKRFEEGNPTKALDFTSEAIPPIMVASIKGALEGVTTPAQVDIVFKEAANWSDYHE